MRGIQKGETGCFWRDKLVTSRRDEAGPLVRVCDGLSCVLAESESLLDRLTNVLAGRARVVATPCLGRCEQAPTVLVGHHALAQASSEEVVKAVAAGRFEAAPPTAPNLLTYTLQGGYRLLRACLDGRRSPEEIIAVLHDAGLRGLGGSGQPTAAKWRRVKNQPGPHALVVDGTESRPGTFKDRAYLEHDPHRFLEGALIAAWAVDAAELFIVLRDDYSHLQGLLIKEIIAAEDSGLTGGRSVQMRREASSCRQIEDTSSTLVNGVETLYWVRDIVERGAAWWRGFGRRGYSGLISFSVSGRVSEPGVKIAPAGITARELIDEFCGGMMEGHVFWAYLPGSAAGPLLPASQANIPLDFGSLEPYGAQIGAAALIVLSDHDAWRESTLDSMGAPIDRKIPHRE